MEGIDFKKFDKHNIADVYNVALQSWKHTYKNIFSREFIENYTTNNYSEKALLYTLIKVNEGKDFFEVTFDKDIMIGFSNIGDRGQGWELFRIYILPEYIGKGIGKALLIQGEQWLKSKNATSYFCMVHKCNELGKRFYLRNNFLHIITNDKDDEWYMRKSLLNKRNV